jgi:hypothetical protein
LSSSCSKRWIHVTIELEFTLLFVEEDPNVSLNILCTPICESEFREQSIHGTHFDYNSRTVIESRNQKFCDIKGLESRTKQFFLSWKRVKILSVVALKERERIITMILVTLPN